METTVAVAGVKVVIIVIHPDHIFCNSTDLLLVCLQLHRFHWSLTSLIITRRWLLLTALPLSGMTISTSQFTADSTQHAARLLPVPWSIQSYTVGKKTIPMLPSFVFLRRCLIGFLSPWGTGAELVSKDKMKQRHTDKAICRNSSRGESCL